MASGGNPQNMAAGLQNTIQQLAGLMVLPDADVQFLTSLQQAIIGYIKNKAQGGGAAGNPSNNAPPAMAPPSAPQGLPSNPQMGGGPSMGLGAGMPPIDELKKMLSQGIGAGAAS